MQTREQERAQRSWEALTADDRFGEGLHIPLEPAEGQTESEASKKQRTRAKQYLNGLNRTAASIYVAGLGQALAFLWARHKKIEAYGDVGTDLSSLVLKHLAGPVHEGQPAPEALLGKIRDDDIWTLMMATEEALGLISWLKRYLEGAGVEPEDPDAAAETEDVGGDADARNAPAEAN